MKRLIATCLMTWVGTTFAAGSTAGPSDPPDLFPSALIAPQKADVGTQVPVLFIVGNFGGTPAEAHTVEILLTKDQVIDQDDLVVASVTTPLFGQISLLADIPSDLEQGFYQWAIRILPVKGETNTANNQMLGLGVEIIKIDLTLPDPGPIVVFSRLSEPTSTLPEPEVIVTNGGTPETVLIYTSKLVTDVSWLTIDPPQNYSVSGEAPTPNKLRFDKSGLAIGTYQTTIRFQNVFDPTDFEDLPITLSIGEPKFVAGDRVQGQVSMIGDVDEIVFDGLVGMTIPFEVKTGGGELKTLLTITDPTGNVEAKLAFQPSNDYLKKSWKLKATGEYRLRIEGKNDTTGGYKIRTSRKMPTDAKPHSDVLIPGETIEVLALGGAVLDISAKPNQAFEGPLSVAVTTPLGELMDTAGFTTSEPGSLLIKGVPLPTSGQYTIDLTGFGDDPNERVDVSVQPVQPKKEKKKIYLD